MRSKFLKRFDEYCGITKVFNEILKKEFYVVYGYFMPDDLDHQSYELGDAIGKGETKEEAYQDAIRFLVETRREYERQSEKLFEILDSFKGEQYTPCGQKEKIVLPHSCGNCDENIFNSTILLNEKTKETYEGCL